jgi:hypothetical protein
VAWKAVPDPKPPFLRKRSTAAVAEIRSTRYNDKFEIELNQNGLTREKFEQWMFHQLKADYDRIFPKLASFLQSLSAQTQGLTGTLAREAHNKALERDLIPQTRLEILERFVWRIEPGPASGLVLPDCVAVSWTTEGGYQPLMTAGKEIDAALMPVRHDRLLVGHRAGTTAGLPGIMNEVAVVCSRPILFSARC